MFTDFAIGVSSGVAATALVWLLGTLIKNSVLPRIRSAMRGSPDVSGYWQTFYDVQPDAESIGEMELTQVGNRVTGTAISRKSRTGEQRTRHWDVTGKFDAGQLLIIYEDKDLRGYVAGVGFFKLSTNGAEFVGKVIYPDKNTGRIKAYSFVMRRNGSRGK